MEADERCIRDVFAWAWAASNPPADPAFLCETRDAFSARLERLRAEHRAVVSDAQANLMNAVLAEIGGNSFDHNLGQWRDVQGVYLADAVTERDGIVVIADRGQGVRTTLQRAVTGTLASDLDALRLAFLQRITGSVGERRGNGLKYVREIVREHDMGLSFQSGNGLYETGPDGDTWQEVGGIVHGCVAILRFPRI